MKHLFASLFAFLALQILVTSSPIVTKTTKETVGGKDDIPEQEVLEETMMEEDGSAGGSALSMLARDTPPPRIK